ncbi:hypothetical protein [Mangrovimonas sp. DI 80]|uniref:hypothetical protein n=1 Tax=Mangrovimonas sp. DI 80 TaxID=1779330 RepID=UPI000F4E2DC1|nr:hypothetical protein [Mangrovimonas sp. DI 80]
MKKIILIVMLLFGFQSFAQNAEMEAFKDLFNSEKKMALGEFLDLETSQSAKFWEIYNDYTEERKDLANRRIALLKKYAYQYGTFTDEQASEIVKETFSIRDQSDKILWKYYKKYEKEFGAKTAAKFVQFELYVQTSIDNELQTAMPLIETK